MKLSGTKRKRDDGGTARGRIILIVCFAVIALLLVGAVALMNYVNRINTIFPNVRVDGLDISGMTLEETAQFLHEQGYDALGDATVTAQLPEEVVLSVRADEVCTETPVSDIALMAYDACKGSSAVGDTVAYVKCLLMGLDLDSESVLVVDETAVRARVESAAKELRMALIGSDLRIGEDSITVLKGAGDITIDTEALTARIVQAFRDHNYETFRYEAEIHEDTELDVQSLYEQVFAEKADAVFTEEHGIEPETVGVSFDTDEAQRLWDAAAYGEEVCIPLIFDYPEVTQAQLEETLFRDQLSTLTTSLWGSTLNRINNVEKAAASINDVILMPGEEFCYNTALGKRTPENGYLLAGAYSGGQTVQEYGGGICQVSSTLYYCSLYANLEITSRTCHYFPVGYIPAGLDATVSWGGPEFKFVNNREYPIVIKAAVDREANSVTVDIWGTDVDGSYVQMGCSTWLVYDEEYEEVEIGYKAQSYRSVYAADGTLLSRKGEAASYYHYHEEDIEWPEESPEPSEDPTQPTDPVVPEDPSEPTDPVESTVPVAPETTPAPEQTLAPGETSDPEETPQPTEPVPEQTPAPGGEEI
ncbi:MAG: hypothetical protein E7472_05690 [Ruminococcaceae bacterium]|nr:hypothetical protein [Oscillospiraceae bacterium]